MIDEKELSDRQKNYEEQLEALDFDVWQRPSDGDESNS